MDGTPISGWILCAARRVVDIPVKAGNGLIKKKKTLDA